jgi:capsule polysaccharide export protein KpsE/RkpR
VPAAAAATPRPAYRNEVYAAEQRVQAAETELKQARSALEDFKRHEGN